MHESMGKSLQLHVRSSCIAVTETHACFELYDKHTHKQSVGSDATCIS